MLGGDDDGHAARLQPFVKQVGDLAGQPLLELGLAGQTIDHAGNLVQSNNPPARDVADVGGADERQQVVLAHRLQADVAQDHHLLVLLVKAAFQQRAGVLVQAAEDLGVHFGHPLRSPLEPLTRRVLANAP